MLINKKFNRINRQAGDTIIEVLIAIAIAGFAIGTSYSIANKSLQRAISAKERNEALNIAESQVTALKVRFKADQIIFRSPDTSKGFVVDPANNTVGTKFNFCLNEKSAGVSDTVNPWQMQMNGISSQNDLYTLADTAGGGKYNVQCKKTTSGTDYFVNIAAMVTSTSQTLVNKTVYKVTVTWAGVGSQSANQSVIYYRI